MKATACLLSWRRPYHIPTIAESLRRFPEIDEILCWCNEYEPTPEIEASCDRVIHSPENLYVYGRYAAAKEARNSICYTADDDLVAHNVSELIAKHYLTGKITANLADDSSSQHWTIWQHRNRPWVEMGFGSVFCREQAAILDEWPYDRNLLLRKSDKVVSLMNDWEAVRVTDLTRLRHNGQESGRDKNALWLRKDHRPLNKQAVRLALEWKESCRQPN
jgi:hypothetical protein